jgi:hypothetical protein
VQQFKFTNNLAKANAYGIIGTSHGVGNDTISAFLPASTITMNVLAGASANSYPAGNAFPTTAQFEAQFVSYSSGDYRLAPSSPWHSIGTDGLDLGAIFGAQAVVTTAPAAQAAPSASSGGQTTASATAPSSTLTPDERPWLRN